MGGYDQISDKWRNIRVVNKIIFLWFYSVQLFFFFSFVLNSFSIFYNFTEIHVTVGFDLQSLMVYSEKDEKIGRSIQKCTVSENKYILLDVLLCSIAEYFYELCCILASP